MISDLSHKNKILIEKIFFSEIFYHYVKTKKGDFALKLFEHIDKIVAPNYIKEGVKWINS